MKKILIAILGGTHNLYMHNFKYLLDHYLRVIDKFGIPADVIYYIGDGDKLSYDSTTHILQLDVPDYDTSKKFKKLNEFIQDKGYDIIIKTNASTIINIRLLNGFIQSSEFNDDYIFGPSTTYNARDENNKFLFNFFQGFFTIYSSKYISSIINIWDKCVQYIFEINSNIKEHENDNYGNVDDDPPLGMCCKWLNIPLKCLFMEYELFSTHNSVKWTLLLPEITNICDFSKITFILCKSGDALQNQSLDTRDVFEPAFIQIFGAIFEGLDINDNIIKEFVEKNSDYGEELQQRIIVQFKHR